MPLRLSDLARQTKTASITYAGEAVNVTFRHRLITPNFVAELSALDSLETDTAAKLRAISARLVALVASWDVEDAPGEPFPLDVDRLAADIPLDFQLSLLAALAGAAQPGGGQGEAAAPDATQTSAGSGAIS